MAATIKLRRDLAANWTSANPTLASGEVGVETDTNKIKIGTGVDAWTVLPYFADASSLSADIVDALNGANAPDASNVFATMADVAAVSPVWGSITGTLSDQTDLQSALNAKQDTLTFGTGVQTALGVNIGTAGSFVVNGGALGTPSSGTLTNTTGLPIVGGTTGTLTIARGGTNLTALGTALQLLRVNAGATALEYFTPSAIVSPLLPTTGTGTATGAVVGELAGNTLNVQQGGNDFLSIDPTAGAEITILKAHNVTGGSNNAYVDLRTDNSVAQVTIQADFNAEATSPQIVLNAGSGVSSITHIADQHTIDGAVRINDLGGSGSGIVAVDNDGDLSFMATPASGADTALSNLASVAVNTTIASDTDNTDDLGTSSISWKDIYARRVRLDGSTSGTADIFSDSLSNVISGTVLSGTGTIPVEYGILVRSDETLVNTNADQPLFTNAAHDVFTILPNTTYDFEFYFDLTHGAASHDLQFGMIPTTATITNIAYFSILTSVAIGSPTTSQYTTSVKTTATNPINLAGSNAVESVMIKGWFTVGNTGGTITPTIQFSVDPTGTILLKTGARAKLVARGNDTFTEDGPIG